MAILSLVHESLIDNKICSQNSQSTTFPKINPLKSASDVRYIVGDKENGKKKRLLIAGLLERAVRGNWLFGKLGNLAQEVNSQLGE